MNKKDVDHQVQLELFKTFWKRDAKNCKDFFKNFFKAILGAKFVNFKWIRLSNKTK